MLDHLRRFFRERAYWSTGVVFAINSLLFAFWVTRLPEIKEALALSEGQLGAALFCVPVGALLAMFTVSRFIQRSGAGYVTLWTSTAYILCMPFPFLADNLWQLGISLFIVGVTSGAMDIAMNAVAALLEKEHEETIMSTCHGFFSLGGLIGAGIGSVSIALGVTALLQILGGIALSLILLWIIVYPMLRRHKAADGHEESGWALPGRALIGLAIIGFCSMQGEGAITDWSAIYMDDIAGAADYMWAFGFAGFSLSMTLGRFLGDGITQRFRTNEILVFSFLTVIVGLAIVLIGRPWSSIGGFTLAGAGYALLIPIVFSEGAKRSPENPSKGIAAVATMGYMGFLLGPVVIGVIAELYDLRMGMIYLVVLMFVALGIAVVSRKNT